MGLTLGRQFSQTTQLALTGGDGCFHGVHRAAHDVLSLNGNTFQMLKQVVILVLGLMLAKIIGRLWSHAKRR